MVFWFKIYVYPLFFHWSFLTIESPAERLILDFFGLRSSVIGPAYPRQASNPILKENSPTARKGYVQIKIIP
jgi:hypothetical protein